MNKIKKNYDKSSNFIDFKINGRLFPSWIASNFKKYQLDEINKEKDPCNVDKEKNNVLKMRPYQEFLTQYFDYKSPYKDILIYHGVGSGKTGATVNIYNALYNYNPEWNVFLLIPASLKNDPWLKDIKKWLSKSEYNYRFKNIIFIHYDSPFAGKDFIDAIRSADSSKKSLFIIEEVHNFIRNVYSNISSSKGKRALTIYDYIIQQKKDNMDLRVICLSATPAINNPFELSLLFNLLRPGIFPMSENKFNHLFVKSSGYTSINNANKNLFQRRIMGLVSYYIGATPDYYAEKTVHYVDVIMSDYQKNIYSNLEDIEAMLSYKSKGKGGSQVYKSYTRQASNFVFPYITQNINGDNRPRPNKFRISEREALAIEEGNNKLKKDKKSEKILNVSEYIKAINLFISSFKNHLKSKHTNDIKDKHTIFDDIKIFINKYNKNFNEFLKEKKKSSLFNELYKCSAKYVNCIFKILISPGPVLIYSNYVKMEGLEIFKIFLNFFGFYNYLKNEGSKGLSYVEFHGDISKENREKSRKIFNQDKNIYGEIVKIIMISPAGTEGISLMNVRQVHILEPYWNEVRIEQIIGRALRQCAHKNLKLKDRHIDIFRYKSIRGGFKLTTDQKIEDLARSKSRLIQSFLDAIKEVAVDCLLNKNHNTLANDYKCFQFNQKSLFQKYVGPAYKENIKDDLKINNGSNNINSKTVRIKAREIKAVKLISKDSDKPVYSSIEKYWMYDKTGVVYDYKLKFPIGKVNFKDNLLEKLSKDVYIISQLIPIPLL
jgi:superfamily II DNA or RNA helicase